jgi:tetratricopeptide (TPR) repeat protein
MMADCERALGRPEKALAMAAAPEVKKLSKPSLVEMRIVAAGARADLGQLDAAVVTLQTADLNTPGAAWVPRLRFAYAAALEAAGRPEEARQWYVKAAEADPEGETDAVERLQELDGISFYTDDDEDAPDDDEQVASPPPAPEPVAEVIEVEHLDAEPLDSEPLDSEPLDTEPLEAEPLDTAPIEAAPAAVAPALAVGGPLFLDAALPVAAPDEDEDP